MHNLIFKKKEKENNKKFTLNIGNLIRMWFVNVKWGSEMCGGDAWYLYIHDQSST
jgi:hypothetical protein